MGAGAALGLVLHGVRWRFRQPGWCAVFAALLALVLIGVQLWQGMAGWVAGGFWLAFVAIPGWSSRWMSRLATREQFGAALLLARVVAVLHPMDGWRQHPHHIDLLARLQRAELAEARAIVDEIGASSPALERLATLLLLRMEGHWAELRAWTEEHIGEPALWADPTALAMYTRALGEVGDVDALLAYEAAAVNRFPQGQARNLVALFTAAFTGQRELTRRLLAGRHGDFPQLLKHFWEATAAQTAGQHEEAAELLRTIAATSTPALRRACAQRLGSPLAAVDAGALPDPAGMQLDEFLRQTDGELRYRVGAVERRPMVTVCILAVLAFFYYRELTTLHEYEGEARAWEVALVKLGALSIPLPEGESWRLVTAGLLHYGWTHLLLNSLALLILGWKTERIWGHRQLLLSFLLSMIGANLAATWFYQSAMVVGASGGVFGVFGALLVRLALGWRAERIRGLGRTIGFMLVVVALQVVFDASHEQVSGSVHLSGLVIGAAVGALLFAVDRSPRSPPRRPRGAEARQAPHSPP